jgi:cupin 2 domain-containing protein
MKTHNFFSKLAKDLSVQADPCAREVFETLAGNDKVRIERIQSHGQHTPEGEWYEQDQSEWVMLIEGAARLEFEDGLCMELGPGDYLDIPAHRRHRVAWTSPTKPSLWLAVFY